MSEAIASGPLPEPVEGSRVASAAAASPHSARWADALLLSALADGVETLAGLWGHDDAALQAHARAAVSLTQQLTPGVESASLLRATRHARPATLAASSPSAARLDQWQVRTEQGPAVEALTQAAEPGRSTSNEASDGSPPAQARVTVASHSRLVATPDIGNDARWPALAATPAALGVRSVLSIGLPLPSGQRAALTIASSQPAAFTDPAVSRVRILAAAIASGLAADALAQEAAQMRAALHSNREIGAAIGILMSRRLCTADQAWHFLRATSERQHRRLREVASDVVLTGDLPEEIQAQTRQSSRDLYAAAVMHARSRYGNRRQHMRHAPLRKAAQT